MNDKVIHGVLDPWIETGNEGVVWTVYEDDKTGYDGIIALEKGDHLTIYGSDNGVMFDDIIKPDKKAGWQPYDHNPKYGQPSALGYWVHWTQSGYSPDDWARLFFQKPPLRADIVKRQPRKIQS